MTVARALAVACVALATALPACASVLGLDAPTLDPCVAGPCGDAGKPDGSVVGDGAARDGAPDVGVVTDGVRCGGGAYPITACTGATPVCCQVAGPSAGSVAYACRATAAACEGYAIACASDDDCSGSNVCCSFGTSIKCDKASTCADRDLVCQPGAANDCPSGWTCTEARVLDGATSPYYACVP